MSRTIVRQLRLNESEDRRLKRIAEDRGISVSELLRDSALGKRVRNRRLGVGVAERERGGKPGAGLASRPGGLEGTAGSRSAAPGSLAPVAPAVRDPVPVFRCPVSYPDGDECCFSARTPKAVCPVHGRKVVAA